MFTKSFFAAALMAVASARRNERFWYATCAPVNNPALTDSTNDIAGLFKLRQRKSGGDIWIRAQISGLTPDQKHGLHVHGGAFDGETCGASGGHFNPAGNFHGAFNNDADDRHVGDLKMLEADADGFADYTYVDALASLDSTSENYIGGRSLTIHALEDDLGLGGDAGSQAAGNAGPRIGCCNIEIVSVGDFFDQEFRDYVERSDDEEESEDEMISDDEEEEPDSE